MEQREYLDQLVVSLRLRKFSDERVHQTVAEVESHLEASGSSPLEAFGPPSEFAENLEEARPLSARRRRAESISLVAILVGVLLAVLLALEGLGALLAGGVALVTLGDLIALGVMLVGAFAVWASFVAYADGRRSRWLAVAVFAVFALSGGAVASLVNEPVLFALSGWVLLVAAVLAVAVVLVATRLVSRAAQNV